MDPELLRGAFRLGFLIFALALIILPFQDRSSPEFVVTVLAVIVGGVFIAIVTFLARTSLPPRPPRGDRTQSTKER